VKVLKDLASIISMCNINVNDGRALERWETNTANPDVTPQAIFLIAKSLMKRDGTKNQVQANAIADCLENQFTLHDLCDENQATVRTLLEAIENNSHERIRPCELQKLINSL
jgi:hypothetical protein